MTPCSKSLNDALVKAITETLVNPSEFTFEEYELADPVLLLKKAFQIGHTHTFRQGRTLTEAYHAGLKIKNIAKNIMWEEWEKMKG